MKKFRNVPNPFTGGTQRVLSDEYIQSTASSLFFKEGVATVGDLPSTGNVEHDARFVNDTHHLYIWDGDSWQDQGDIIDINWATIEGKPTSTVVDIDDAVSKKHSNSLDHAQNTDTILLSGGSGGEELFNNGILKTNLLSDDGIRIEIDEIRARDGDGLKLCDNNGFLGVFVEDDGQVGIGNTNPAMALDVSAGNYDGVKIHSEDVTSIGDEIGVYFGFRRDVLATWDTGAKIVAKAEDTTYPKTGLAFHTGDWLYGVIERVRIDYDGNVGIGITTPDATALLDISSTTKGFLPPRMTASQRNAISSPATGLMLYDTTNDKMDFYNGSVWKGIVTAPVATLTPGCVPFAIAGHHIDDDVNLFWDNINKRLGIGTNILLEPLTIDVGDDTYGGIEITNSNNGSGSQTGLILRTVHDTSKRVGTAGTYGWQLVARNDNWATASQREDLMLEYYDNNVWRYVVFFEHDTGNIGIGTEEPEWLLDVDGSLAGKKIIMNRGATQSPYIMKGAGLPSKGMSFYTVDNHRMIIAENGNVGIGVNAYPDHKLHVQGNVLIEGLQGFDSADETAILYIGDTQNYIKNTYEDLIDIEGYNGVNIRDTNGIIATFEDGNVTLNNQSIIATSPSSIGFTSLISGSAYYPAFRTADSDRTDDLKMILSGWYQDDSNMEFLFFGWDEAEQQYEIRSNALGSGNVQNLSIFTLGNDNQLFLKTDGNVGIGKIPTEKLDVVGNIAVTGTVDGRDISEDGTALDDLESAVTKLQRVSNGVFETAQTGVEYYSPNQHGRIYGEIYRQYHGVKTNGQTLTTTGIERLIDFGGMMNGDMTYRGHTHSGSEYIWVHREINSVQFNVSGWNIDDGWVDYAKT